MKVLITGGCGYLGCSVVDSLCNRSEVESIALYDNLSRKNTNIFIGQNLKYSNKVTLVEGDILDSYKLSKSLEGIDTVIHLAAIVSTPFADRNAHGFDQINNWGTGILVNLIEKSKTVSDVIYISSVSVYGDTGGKEANEYSLTAPKTFYGVSKLNGEKHISRLAKSKNTIIFRVGNIFGYNRCLRLDAVINRFMFDAHFKGKIEIHGNGSQKRSFIDVQSVARVISKSCFGSYTGQLVNLVRYNFSILEITNEIKLLYPEVDILHLDQHLRMRSITTSSAILADIDSDDLAFEDQLYKIQNHFSF